MNTLLDRIFGFNRGTFGGQDAGVGFASPLPSWLWVIALLAIGLLVWLSYRNLSGPRWARVALSCVRWSTLVLLLALALGPEIQRQRTLVEPDRVLVLLDTSGSMGLPEIASDGSTTTRAGILSMLLEQNAQVFEQIAQDSALDVYTFTDRIAGVDGLPSVDPNTIAPGSSTSLGNAIRSALSGAGTNPVSGIVLMSDGQSHDQPSQSLIETLLSSGIPVISIPIGSDQRVHDASIRQIESPQAVFAKDRVPVHVVAEVDGYSTGDEVLIELIDQATGTTLTSTTKAVGNERTIQADLSHTFSLVGPQDLLVRLTPHGSAPDLVSENNQQPIELRVVSEPMRVLYIDGQPRWEYRYLKNLLLREETINATTMLLASDRSFIEEGQSIAGPIPETLEDWEPYDVVVLGDVRPDLFSAAQLGSLKDHIETRGCGLLWIAGEGATPVAWSGSALASLLPMQDGKSNSISRQSSRPDPIVMRLTDNASRVGLLSGEDDDESGSTSDRDAVSDPDAGWTILRWNHAVALDALKPGVSTLALAQQLDGSAEQSLVTTMRYGGGQVGFVGTDEIWRWRYGRGEELPQRFWLPLIRTLARGTIARRASPAALTVSPERIIPGNDVRATLELFDSAVIDNLPQQLDATLRSLSSGDPGSRLVLSGIGDRRSAIWTSQEPGVYALSVSHPLLGSQPITRTVRVSASWDESTNPNTDHPALESISTRTGGRVLNGDQLSQLPNILPNRTRITTLSPETTPLWDRPIVLILLVLLLSIEWIGRRTLRLA